VAVDDAVPVWLPVPVAVDDGVPVALLVAVELLEPVPVDELLRVEVLEPVPDAVELLVLVGLGVEVKVGVMVRAAGRPTSRTRWL
jgi:hypothetical protein